METTSTILLILLVSVSGLLIVILIALGYKIWKIVSALERITSLFSDETDQVKHIMKKVRTKIHSILE